MKKAMSPFFAAWMKLFSAAISACSSGLSGFTGAVAVCALESENVNSRHPGGANVLFADGSVHFLKSSISIKTYWALGTRGNGEVVSSDSY